MACVDCKMAQFADTGAAACIGLGNRRSGFTFLQLQELEHQALIYKYMLAGAPVPFHLVLPIWKSVASSAGGIYKHHPTWFGSSSLYFDYRNNMEAEPGRCRRTDGKKWRCSKEVVPGQKYCERHMHRGRQRSRKPVEGPAPAMNNTPTIQNAADSTTRLSISMPGGEPPTTTAATSFSPTSVLHPNTCKTEPSL